MVPLDLFQYGMDIPSSRFQKPTLILMCVGGIGFFALRTWLVWRGLDDPNVTVVLSEWIPREVDRSLHVQLLTQTESWVRYMGLWAFPKTQTLFHHFLMRTLHRGKHTAGSLDGLLLLSCAWFGSRNNPLALAHCWHLGSVALFFRCRSSREHGGTSLINLDSSLDSTC